MCRSRVLVHSCAMLSRVSWRSRSKATSSSASVRWSVVVVGVADTDALRLAIVNQAARRGTTSRRLPYVKRPGWRRGYVDSTR
eukprot:5868344-Ditylum_brightwellii.AAC.1